MQSPYSTNAENIRFHIKMEDYFGTLATRVDILRQGISGQGYSGECDQALAKVTEELLFLQKNYAIAERYFSQESK